MDKENIIIWGTGDIAKRLLSLDHKWNVLAYADSNQNKWGLLFEGAVVVSPSKIVDYEYDYIIIANVYNYKEIYEIIINELGIKEDKIRNFSEFISVNFTKFNCGDIKTSNYEVNFLQAVKDGDIKLGNDLETIVFSEEQYLITKYLHYFEIYDKFFSSFRNREITILEIGVYKGGSLYLWKKYFGNNATVVGIDINPECKKYEDEKIFIEIGVQGDETFLNSVINKYGPFDIILDDGSHKCSDQIESFRVLFEAVKDGGIYLCEDVHTSYNSEWEGGYHKSDSFIEYSKNLIDYIHGYHIENIDIVRNNYTKEIHGIHYYNNMVVIEKRESLRPLSFVGNKNFFHIPMANTLSEE